MKAITTKARPKAALRAGLKHLVGFLFVAALSVQTAMAQDFIVTTPGDQFAYVINGTNNNPTITLVRGNIYTFAVDTSSDHPIAFAVGAPYGPTPDGVFGDQTSSGTITYAVPTNAPDCVYYCTVHGFGGNIQMIDPTPTNPPAMTILSLTVGTNLLLTVKQSSTNGFTFIPQANTNFPSTNWFALTVQSNVFANGTNEIWCGKPPGSNVFLRIRAQ